MEGSPESLEEMGPVRCLRMSGALLRMDGEPLAATWLNENSVVAIDDQGVVETTSRGGGLWKRARPYQLIHMPTLAGFCLGKSGLFCSVGPELGVWPLGQPEPLWWLETESWVTAVAGHPVLGLVAGGHEDGSVSFWDAETGKLLRRWNRSGKEAAEKVGDISISALAWHPVEPKVLVADESLALLQIDLETNVPKTISSGHKGRIVTLGFDPKNRFIYSGGWDGTVRVWDSKTGAPVILLNNHASLVTCLSIFNDGASLCVGDNSPSWALWDVPGWQKREPGNPLPAEPRCIEIGPSGAESLVALQDGRVLNFGWEDSVQLGKNWVQKGTHPRPACLKESDDSFLCLGAEGGVQRWVGKKQGSPWDGTHSSDHVGDFGGPVKALAFAAGERGAALLTSQPAPGALKAYQSANAGASFHLVGVSDNVPGEGELVALSPQGDWAVCASERALDIIIYRFPSLEPVAMIPDPLVGASCQDLAFGPCGRYLAMGGVNTFAQTPDIGAAVVVEVGTGKICNSIGRGVWRLAWHPGGHELLLSGPNGDLVRWRPETGMIEVLEHTSDGPMQVVGYSRGGDFKVASCGNEELWVFEGDRRRPAGTVSLPGRVIAVTPGKKAGAIVALLAGGDGWEVDLPEWLSEEATRMA